MASSNRRDPNPNDYDISKVIAHRTALAKGKKQLKNAKAAAKKAKESREKQGVKDRIFSILERHKANKLEAY